MVRDGRRSPAAVQHPAVDRALARLDEFAGLPENWDSYGAATATVDAVEMARTLILTVAEATTVDDRPIVPATSAPIPDGGIQVEWDGPAARIEVQVAPDGSLGYVIERFEDDTPRFDEADDLPFTAAVALICRLAGDQRPS